MTTKVVPHLSSETLDSMKPKFFSYPRRNGVRNPDDQEDILQDALLHMFRRTKWNEVASIPVTHVWTILRDSQVSHFRRCGRALRTVSLDLAAECPAKTHDFAAEVEVEELRPVVNRLPPMERELFALRFYDRYSLDAVAHRLGVSRKTVCERLARIKAKLRLSWVSNRPARRPA